MYNHDLKAGDCYYADTQTVPQGTAAEADGNGGAMQLSNTLGGIEVKGVVTTAVVMADTKAFTITLKQSSDNGVDDAYASKATLYTKTASGTETVAANTVLFNYNLPSDTEKYTKVTLSTTDDAITGAVSVYGRYLPR